MNKPTGKCSLFCRLQCLIVSFCIVVLSMNPIAAYAQGADVDIELPEIMVEQNATAALGEPQTVVANVIDNSAVESVTLFFRFDQSAAYLSVPMKASSSASRYLATVDTTGQNSTAFQYYIKAVDTSGNIRFRGFTFSPLTWGSSPDVSTTQQNRAVNETASPNEAPVKKSGNRTLYTVLGVLAAVALAGLASSGGGGSGGGGEPCATEGCTLTLTGQPPQN